MRRIERGPGQPPVFRQLAAILRDAITAGTYAPGELLPTEAVLCHEYDVGLDTVKDALAVLRHQGLIETKRGRGWRVRPAQQVTIIHAGPGARISSRMPTEAEQQHYSLPDGVPLLVIRTGDQVRILPADQHEIAFDDDD